MPKRPPTVAVVTGDVLDSSALSVAMRRRLHAVMREGSSILSEVLAGDLPLPVDIFSGDSWQLYTNAPGRALRAALLYRAHLRGETDPRARRPVDTRAMIAIGPVQMLPSDRVGEGEGEAFRLSGRGLVALRGRCMGFAVAPGHGDPQDWDVTIALVDAIASEWTARQARAVAGALRGWQQERIAQLWKPTISQPSVAKHLRAARWEAISAAVERFESRFTVEGRR